jgi:hypothetical protein
VADFNVEIYGLAETKRLMRELEPELLKTMNREIRTQLEPVAARARSLLPSGPPLSGWNRKAAAPGSRPSYTPYHKRWDGDRLAWNRAEAASGIVIRQGGGRRRGQASRAAWQIRSNNPAAAVFELMGRGRSDTPMVQNVSRKHPGTGRVLYRAFDQVGGRKIEGGVVDSIRRFEAEFTRRLDAAGGT